MKNRRWFFVLSVLLLASLLCALGPAALAEGPDSEIAFRANLANLSLHSDEIKTMREDALADYLNCLFAAEDTDDPRAQEQFLNDAELYWMLYTDLLAVQYKAEIASWAAPEFDGAEADPFLDGAEQRPEGKDEFCFDECWPSEEDFLPYDSYLYGGDEYDWGFEGCPFAGANGPWQQNWAPSWGYWDDAYYNDYDGDFWSYDPDQFTGAEAAQNPDANVPATAEAPEQAEQKDDTALSTEEQAKPDPVTDWSAYEELFVQALLEAIFGEDAQDTLALPNPWIETASADEAAAVSGLRLDAPEALPKDMELQNYRAMEDIVEADYSNGNDELVLRASLNQKGLALTGDYNDYSARWQVKVGDLKIECLGDTKKINAAAWTVDGVNYALDMAPGKEGLGLSYDEVSAITAAVSAIPVQTEFKAEPAAEPAVPSDEALEMPFELTDVENQSSEAVETAAEELTESKPTAGRQVRLIVGGGETYVYFD